MRNALPPRAATVLDAPRDRSGTSLLLDFYATFARRLEAIEEEARRNAGPGPAVTPRKSGPEPSGTGSPASQTGDTLPFPALEGAVETHPSPPERTGSPASSSAPLTPASPPDEEGSPGSLAAAAARRTLEATLHEQTRRATEARGPAWTAQVLPDAQYAMAALADERLGAVPRGFGAAWRRQPLTAEVFGKTDGGAVLFDRIDALLEGTAHRGTPDRAGLAGVYLTTLALGYEGKYGRAGGERILAEYRDELLHAATEGEPDPDPLFTEAYRHTHSGGEIRLLPRVRLYRWATLGVVLLLFFVSWWVWKSAVHELEADVEQAERLLDADSYSPDPVPEPAGGGPVSPSAGTSEPAIPGRPPAGGGATAPLGPGGATAPVTPGGDGLEDDGAGDDAPATAGESEPGEVA